MRAQASHQGWRGAEARGREGAMLDKVVFDEMAGEQGQGFSTQQPGKSFLTVRLTDGVALQVLSRLPVGWAPADFSSPMSPALYTQTPGLSTGVSCSGSQPS